MCPNVLPEIRKFADIESDINAIRIFLNPTSDEIVESLDHDLIDSRTPLSEVNNRDIGIFDNFFYSLHNQQYEQRDDINPYDENLKLDEISPKIDPPNSNYQGISPFPSMPSPDQVENPIFMYQLENGEYVALRHPLPPEINVDIAVMQYRENRRMRNNHRGFLRRMMTPRFRIQHHDDSKMWPHDLGYYALVTIIPILGIPLYFLLKKSRPKLAGRILNYMMAVFVIVGSILLLIL
ncbi:hypothetical protein TVAG_191970 [Trichomonas vaginalis G3]|uniref:Uncharacterized protein n=1 Tax=Trichomonas vaginalis (strain ATCC PRA-98 / G3) TaxID=412133 RepID=A2ETU3_TRIV3|nr:hypothetical protein TVAGG3_0892570 [Trichomonas vaginalis G3]EAY03898.1 hypothetical protein TVAG_191970 [Trichomonas vaginalis G3]KAI5502826.1 hypothetical protein TVAGG3_0892570 [Trichomonas vaginalis G3]|eukprot:XP_001316121.1 hypothetical protein [Trichomonas vaginalis G3]